MKLKYIDKRWYSETGEGPAPVTQAPAPARRESVGSAGARKPDFVCLLASHLHY